MNAAFAFVFLAIVTSTITKLFYRVILKDIDPYAYAVVTNVVSMLLFLPLAIVDFSLPSSPKAYIVLAFSALVWALLSVANYTAYKGTELSLKEPISRSSIIWTLIWGIFILGENPSTYRILGTLIVFAGISLLLWHPEKKLGRLSNPGILWTLYAAFLYSIAAAIDKAALHWFNPGMYAFLVYFFPLFILLTVIRGKMQKIVYLLERYWKSTLISIVFSVVTYYFTLQAYRLMDVTLVFPLLQLSLLVVVVLSIIFFREYEHLWQRIVAVLVILFGSVLIGM